MHLRGSLEVTPRTATLKLALLTGAAAFFLTACGAGGGMQGNNGLGDKVKDKDSGTASGGDDDDFFGGGSSSNGTGLSSDSDGCKGFSEKGHGEFDVEGKAQAPIIGNINFHLIGEADVQLAVKGKAARFKAVIQIHKAEPALVKGFAQQSMDAMRETLKIKLAPDKLYTKYDSWKGLKCIVVAATRVENSAYLVQYSPALPLTIYPTTDAEDCSEALESARTVKIKAKVTRNPTQGAILGVHSGKATISPTKAKMGGDRAYKISFDFGSIEKNMSAAPFAEIDYHISDSKKSFTGITTYVDIPGGDRIKLDFEK